MDFSAAHILRQYALVIPALLLSSCFVQEDGIHSSQVGSSGSNGNNSAPIADAGDDKEVYEQSRSELNASGSNDPDGSIVSYSWSQVDGYEATIDDPSAESTSFTAPEVENDALLTFQVTVTDDSGHEAQDTVVVTVLEADEAFAVTAGADREVYEFASVQLQAVASGLHSSEPVAYSWSQIGGTEVGIANSNSASASFTAPAVDSSENLTFQVSATNSAGSQVVDSVVITVIKNLAPVADAGADQVAYSLELVELDASASYDPDADAMSYSWTQIDGGAVSVDKADTPLASFQAPELTEYVNLVFRLTLTDIEGNQAYDTVVVEVWPNQAPVAEAGADHSVSEGDTVTLDASTSSDPNNNIASYSWQQLNADSYPVTIANPDQAQATFTAPLLNGVEEEANLTFSVLVTDRSGASASDTITITLLSVNIPPNAHAGADQSIYETQITVLDASASTDPDTSTDPDASTLSYSWQQLNTGSYPVTITNHDQVQATFTAPTLTTETLTTEDEVPLTFRVTVTDPRGGSDTSTTIVTVLYNDPPLALASTDPSGEVYESSVLQLDASASSDAQDSTLTYSWTQIDSSGDAIADSEIEDPDSAIAYFTTPEIETAEGQTANTALSFRVTVTDSLGKQATATAAVIVIDNAAPEAAAKANPNSAYETQTVELNASASSDPDGDATIISYFWEFLESNISVPDFTINLPNSATASFVAPDVDQDANLSFQVTVTDSGGRQDQATVAVTVHNNTAPVAEAGDPQEVYEFQQFILDASASTDAENNIATYLWDQIALPAATEIAADGATITFAAPEVVGESPINIAFELKVTDELDAFDEDSITITVLNNTPPEAIATATKELYEGGIGTLEGNTSTDPENNIATYLWSQSSDETPRAEINDVNADNTFFTAPAVDANTIITFDLTVTDVSGASDSASVAVEVLYNNPPIAVASSPTNSVYETQPVELNASASSDPDGHSLAYSWLQLNIIPEHEVTIYNSNSAIASFNAPEVATDTNLTFQLTATDAFGKDDNATLTIAVFDNAAPEARAKASPELAFENQTITLDASTSTDPDSDSGDAIATYSWAYLGSSDNNKSTIGSIIDSNSSIASFVAPEVDSNTTLTFQLTVGDTRGKKANTTVKVEILDNVSAPVARVDSEQQEVYEDTRVDLDASASSDPDGAADVLSYSWQQLNAGSYSVDITNADQAQATFTAPLLSGGEDEANATLTFQVTVTDLSGAVDTNQTQVAVLYNPPPEVSASSDPADDVYETQVVELNASASDPEGGDGSLSYAWQLINSNDEVPTLNIDSPNSANTYFFAPEVENNTTLTLQLTVTDQLSKATSTSVEITVLDNADPVAAAIADPNPAYETQIVELSVDGDSNPENDIATYSWAFLDSNNSAISAADITIDPANPEIAYLETPEVDSDTNITLQLTLTDIGAKSSSETFEITILDNAEPVAAAEANTSSAFAKQSVELDASESSDDDGVETIASYSWTFLDSNDSSITAADITIESPEDALATFIAPEVVSDADITLQVTVTDIGGKASNASAVVAVLANTAPEAVAEATPQQLYEGEVGTLEGNTSTDPENNIATYLWSQSSDETPRAEINDVNAANTFFTAPAVDANTTITFDLNITDVSGESDSASVAVEVLYNNSPIADASRSTDEAYETQTVELDASASSDPDDHILTYSWLQLDASPENNVSITNATAAIASFTAPEVTAATDLTFQLTVTDELGAEANTTIELSVLDNSAPQAVATASPNPAYENQTITLDASTSSDPDSGDSIATYSWTYLGGSDDSVTIDKADSAEASFDAPEVDSNTTLTFQLTVGDTRGKKANTTVEVEILDNTPPTAQVAAESQRAYENAHVDLDASASSDLENNIASYSWQQLNPGAYLVEITSPDKADQAQAAFTAPTLATEDAEAILTFEVTVTDLSGAVDTNQTEVTVLYNPPPEVSASSDPTGTVYETQSAALNASASDPEGGDGSLSYSWIQLNSGSYPATIFNSATANASFSAPEVSADTILTFQVTVTDSLAKETNTSVEITVLDNAAPEAFAESNQSQVYEGNAVELDASASIDDDGVDTIESYSWTFLDSDNSNISAADITIESADAEVAYLDTPEVEQATALTLQVTVADIGGKESNATVELDVLNNLAPTASAEANPTSVFEHLSVDLDASASSDPDDFIASYSWSYIGNSADDSAIAVTIADSSSALTEFSSSNVENNTTLSFQVTVVDSRGKEANATVAVEVLANTAPVAKAGADQSHFENAAVDLDASASSDAENNIVAYSWQQLNAGSYSVDITNADQAQATFTAPLLSGGEDEGSATLSFQVTVTDLSGESSASTTKVTTNYNPPPNAIVRSSSHDLYEHESLTLDASSSNDSSGGYGNIASYAWQQRNGTSAGIDAATSETVTFSAPEVSADTSITFAVTVADELDKNDTATVVVLVRNNEPPAIEIHNPEQNVAVGAVASLDASATDDTIYIASYAWGETPESVVLSGGVVIDKADTTNATFQVPTDLDTGSVLSFTFVVTDNFGVSSTSDIVTVTIVEEGTVEDDTNVGDDADLDEHDFGDITSPVIGNTERVFFSDDQGNFYALEPDGNSLAWVSKNPQDVGFYKAIPSASILANYERVVFVRDDVIYIFDEASGSQIASYGIGTDAAINTAISIGYESDAYAGHSDAVIPIAFTSTRTLYLIYWHVADERFSFGWSHTIDDPLNDNSIYLGPPVISHSNKTNEIGTDSRIYVGSYHSGGKELGSVFAFNINTGSLRWARQLGSYVYVGGEHAGIDTLIIPDRDGNIQFTTNGEFFLIWDGDDGSKLSHYYANGVYAFTTPPTIDSSNTMYVGLRYVGDVVNASGQYIISAFAPPNEDNKRLMSWMYTLPNQAQLTSESLTIGADGTIYFGASDGKFYGIDSSTGTEDWSLDLNITSDYVTSSPAIAADGTLYFGTDKGNFYTVHSSSPGLDLASEHAWPRHNYDNLGMSRMGWHYPVAQIDANASNDVPVGAVVQLDANASYDIDGEIISYYWEEIGSSADASDTSLFGISFSNNTAARTVFTVPEDLSTDGSITIQLTVTDNAHLTATTTQTINYIVP